MSTNPTNNDKSSNGLIISFFAAGESLVGAGISAVATRITATVAPQLEEVESPSTLTQLRIVTACLSGNHKEFLKEFTKLPDDIRSEFFKITSTAIALLPQETQEPLGKFKESAQYSLIVQTCAGIADPEKVALGKLYLESKIQSMEL